MTVLVTGGGLIGRLTAELLAARGEAVVIADIRPLAAPPPIRTVQCDVTDAPALEAALAEHGVRKIVHTAAMLSTGIRENPARGIAVNVLGTANILEAARRRVVARVVAASSTTVGYSAFGSLGGAGVPEDVPMRQIGERPGSIYAATKLAGEHLALLYADLYGLDTVVLRYGAVLGGLDEPPTSVPGRLLARLVAAGRSGEPIAIDDPYLVWGGREEFVDARDCARANLAALDAAGPAQRVYNIAPGTWHTIGEFVAAVRRFYPALQATYPEDLRTGFAGFPHLRPAPSDVSAARRELGFTCRHDLDDTIAYWTGRGAR